MSISPILYGVAIKVLALGTVRVKGFKVRGAVSLPQLNYKSV